ncbi:hypothetical protein HR15_04350 [Porphyromonas gulae]|uniref:Uncharacterized protein n=1 Tax=Porphyromonas gulae TaxID=111105 RepID=A0A0A2FDL0_9PORP|nr:hypothetical protein HR15_04350 [Porphyromonas gulae]
MGLEGELWRGSQRGEKRGIRSSSYFPLFENVKNDRAETCRQKDLSFIKLDGSGLKKRGAGKFFFCHRK